MHVLLSTRSFNIVERFMRTNPPEITKPDLRTSNNHHQQ